MRPRRLRPSSLGASCTLNTRARFTLAQGSSWPLPNPLQRPMFGSQQAAKRFFVERIVEEAARQGQPLSELEQWMLSFSESDPDFVVQPELVDRLAQEISDADYEAKIARLIEQASARDIGEDPAAADQYRSAYTALDQGDHYLLIMLKPGLARLLRKRWQFWR